VKYLILGSLSTGFIVYGITWIFGATGQIGLFQIRALLPTLPASHHDALLFGVALVLVALGFKIAAVPFQFWVPDVYQGAPTPVTAYLSVGSKAAGFIVLMRILATFGVDPDIQHRVFLAVTVIAGLTVVYGNLAALPQTNVKRLLAYSSVAQPTPGICSLQWLLQTPTSRCWPLSFIWPAIC
jgi:NADH-quinone oxidoreductase subunit N